MRVNKILLYLSLGIIMFFTTSITPKQTQTYIHSESVILMKEDPITKQLKDEIKRVEALDKRFDAILNKK